MTTDKWDIVLYLQTGAQVTYRERSLSETFALIGEWDTHNSNSPVASFRGRRSKQEDNGQ